MKQIIQYLKDGSTEVAEVPVPTVGSGQLLIQTSQTLVSAGTERMLVEFGKAGWVEKARQQPDKVRMVLDKIRSDGLHPTIEAVMSKLDQPIPLGYCNVGQVVDVGGHVVGYKKGERVVSNGKHAQAVSVPINLCAKIPDTVPDKEAVFTVLGAISLQGIRLAGPTLGEAVVVTGLGLIGLLTVQLLRAQGCRVLGLDFDKERLALARQFGAETVDLAAEEDPFTAAEVFSRGRGVDAVIVTAATSSSEPVRQAAQMCRKRGRIVLVGVTGLELSRADFYEKELTFQVSCSYGPGRYDQSYEQKGQDYPVGYVRWTEQRNFEAVLDMMASGRLDVKPLITHEFEIDEAEKAYELVGGSESSLGILLRYPEIEVSDNSRRVSFSKGSPPSEHVGNKKHIRVSFIGAGNYATGVLIPAFREAGAHLCSVASAAGLSGLYAGRKYGFKETTTDVGHIFSDESVDAVVITTRHNSHAELVLRALESGKHVFVEKPLCLNCDELDQIESACQKNYGRSSRLPILMVGFNRRFSPQIQQMKKLLRGISGPKAIVITVNAGSLTKDHWTQDLEIGGGRILGEGCHFVDLLRFLTSEPIEDYHRTVMESPTQDTVSIQLSFADGSIGTIHYLANGSKLFPKERVEIFAGGGVLQLDNFRKLKGFGWPGFKKMNLWRQNKGQKECAAKFLEAVGNGEDPPIEIKELMEVSRVTIGLSQG